MRSIGFMETSLVPVFGEEILTISELRVLLILLGIFTAYLLVIGYLVRRRVRERRRVDFEECIRCGSMNVNHRAGQSVCTHCGYSVRLTEAYGD